MQLPLSFAQEPLHQTESSPDVWQTLDVEQRKETIAVLARLLAKTAAAEANPPGRGREEENE